MAKNILKEAIADAKAVREVALANAKAALEEAFTPKLQSMLSAKLSEDLDETYYDEDEKDMEEGMGMYDEDEKDMDEMMYDEDDMEEAHGGMHYDEDEKDMEEGMHFDEDEKDDSMDEEIDLEEILNELELEEDDKAKLEEEDLEEEDLEEAVGKPNHRADYMAQVHHRADDINQGLATNSALNEDQEFDLDSLLKEINDLDENKETLEAKDEKDEKKEGMHYDEDEKEKMKENKGCSCNEEKTLISHLKSQIAESKKAYVAVRGELNEVNLLNSKLLYVNRIFKANNLSDAQKLRVVETLDKAESVKEAKLIYETVKDTFTISNNNRKTKSTPKKHIRENFKGMASKAIKTSAPRKPILKESNNMVARMQKLANINKINE